MFHLDQFTSRQICLSEEVNIAPPMDYADVNSDPLEFSMVPEVPVVPEISTAAEVSTVPNKNLISDYEPG